MMKKHEILMVVAGAAISVYLGVAISNVVGEGPRQQSSPGKPAAEKWILFDRQGNEIGYAEKR